MFNNLKKLNSGRIRVKIIATMLVLILTLTNFTLLGSYMGKAISSYATDTLTAQDDKTESDNVKFEAYLEESDETVKEKTADINAADLILYLKISVKGEGTLSNASISFENANFDTEKVSTEGEITIGTMQAGTAKTIQVPITAKQDDTYNIALLNTTSQIKLTGEYTDEEGNITDINTTKAVKINWTTEGITAEDINLNQEVITNKVYKIGEENKRVIQILVTEKVADNKAPVKTNTIEITDPQIGVAPEEVKVAAYSTKATNGKTSLEFGDGENSTWEYKAEEGKTYIQVSNPQNEQNEISWAKASEDKYIVTYIYSEETQVTSLISHAKSTTELYGSTAGAIEKENEINIEELEEGIGNIAQIGTSIDKEIYKGNMYIGEETNIQTKATIYVPYSNIANKIEIEDEGDTTTEEGAIATYYKTTTINKAEATKLLGTEGTIKIYNAEDKTTPIKEIDLSEETEEENYTITYEEGISKIAIETSKATTEGTLEITNQKAIKVVDQEQVSQATQIETNTKTTITDENETEQVSYTSQAKATLKEPTTTYKITLDKDTISTQTENEVKATIELKASQISSKLYENPTITINLPKEITNVSIENITPVVGNEEIKLKTYSINETEEANKQIVIQLEGKQTKYQAQDATITLDLKVETESFMADKEAKINTICTNGEENISNTQNIKLISKTGLVTKNAITIGEDKTEKTNQKSISKTITQDTEISISSSIINNFGEEITNVNIIGKIPTGETLTEGITISTEGTTVYYTEEEDPSVETETWQTEVTDYSKIRAYKISIDKMEQGSIIELASKMKAEIGERAAGEEITNNVVFNYEINEQAKQETMAFILKVAKQETKVQAQSEENTVAEATEKISVQIVPTVGGEEIATGAEVNNGQVIRYKVKVTNTSSETLNNIKLTSTIENGVFYDLVEEEGSGYYDDELNKVVPAHKYSEVSETSKELTIETLEAGATNEFEYQAVAYIGEGENANTFKSNMSVIADNMEEITSTDTKTIKAGDISLKLHYSSNEDPKLYSDGNSAFFEIDVANLSGNVLENVPITISLPEQLYCNLDDQTAIDKDKMTINVLENNTIEVNINSLEANEIEKVYIKLTTNSISLDKTEKEITLVAKSTYNGTTYISNEYVRGIYQSKTNLNAEFTSDKEGETLLLEGENSEDKITYTLKLTNNGILNTGSLCISDKVPNELEINSIVVELDSGEKKEYELNTEGNVYINDLELDVGESLTLTISATLCYVGDATQISNTIEIIGSTVNSIEKTLVNKIDNKNSDNPSNTDDPSNPEDPSKTETNTISGLAWIDEDKDGIRDSGEKTLQAMQVLLLDKDLKQVNKTTTSLTGTYKFSNVEQGEYTVAFEYETSKYAVTKYQVEGATQSTNSDAIAKEIEIDGKSKTVAVTNTIKVDGKEENTNIDIGLIENAQFDLSLNKYIKKVTLSNSSGTTTYEYQDTSFAKIEISASKIAGTVMMVEYEIEVTNEGDVNGYVTDIIDYKPTDLEFSSEMNTEWYVGTDNYLHYAAIEPEAIEPGKTQTLKLVLTRTLKSNSTGTIENIAEIGESSSLEGLTEKDSSGGNKQTGEDDISTASLIVSISTGSPIMYIGIVIGSMLVLGFGIYIINKKVLKVRI